MKGIIDAGESDVNTDENETLLDADYLQKSSVIRRKESIDETTTLVTRQPHSCTRLITVEPPLVGTMFLLALYSIISKEYFYQRIASEYNFTGYNTTGQSCGVIFNESDPDYQMHEKVSAETAALSLYLDISSKHIVYLSKFGGSKFSLRISL